VALAIVKTTHGDFTIRLNADASPKAVESFADLARKGFFDGTHFHRIVPGFVVQGGDPTGTGTGGPGYTTVDPPSPDTTYDQGVVAMAKKGDDPAGTAGSQFFVVTCDDVSLPPEYAVIGEVTDGLDVVLAIGELGDAAQKPTERVGVESVTVEDGG
jgi:peptidyl-prolyl cis-trans isomerase B (cyclophilin B)